MDSSSVRDDNRYQRGREGPSRALVAVERAWYVAGRASEAAGRVQFPRFPRFTASFFKDGEKKKGGIIDLCDHSYLPMVYSVAG